MSDEIPIHERVLGGPGRCGDCAGDRDVKLIPGVEDETPTVHICADCREKVRAAAAVVVSMLPERRMN